MITLEQIIDFEINYPRLFASVVERPYARFYYNVEIPHSFDSNHAVFFNLEGDLEQYLEELIIFYRLKSIIPRVYPSYRPHERERLLPCLSRRGFEIKYPREKIYLKVNPSTIAAGRSLQVERTRTMTDAVAQIMRKVDGGDWNIAVLRRQLQSDHFHLLVGYADGEPVCLGVLRQLGTLFRLDEVLTDCDYRGRGYGRGLVEGILSYQERLFPQSRLYLWASNPTAIRIYLEAGFVELKPGLEPWRAAYAPVARGS